ncbi:DUF3794 domain-containing protein [Halobacillus litoralis]|uniref:DUF3794 domain-containing protein n=1 Tax=Halobacillus litoralis TaxID=45668 RepID=A0A845DXK5_9BACI|nr:DUF3794 domain-containing protein [Halobacillus litoralis]MYL21549.1 DUF3794 domain-containing protein [Halobacillus litoralis]
MRKNDRHCVNLNESASIEQCTNTSADTAITPTGERIVRIPVELGAYNVTTNLVANISFPDPVLEIKDIKKRVIITQCRLLTRTSGGDDDQFSTGPFPLFLKGYVRKNIQYATPSRNADGECISSEIKSLTVKVPFECMTTVDLESPAQLPLRNRRDEYDFFRAQDLGTGYPEKDQYLSSDLSQFHQESFQGYNQLPFCELVSSQILEWDEATDRQFIGDGPVDEGYFQHMVEKMQVRFTIKVLQNQQVRVDAL